MIGLNPASTPAGSSSAAHSSSASAGPSKSSSTRPAGPTSTASSGAGHTSGIVAARPGRYHYTVTGKSSTGPVPPAATLTISTVTGDLQTFTFSNIDSSGNGSTQAETLSYRSDGVYLVSLAISTKKPVAYNETLKPVGGPARVITSSGATGSTRFTIASDDASATITFTVIGRTTAHVGSATLPALHVTLSSTDLHGKVDGFSYKNGTFKVDALFSTTSALPYRQSSSSSISIATSNTTATLNSTTPS